MSDILFTHSYFLRFDPKQWKQQQPYPPLGTLYAASVMRKEGYKISMFDTMFAKKAEEINLYLEKEQPKYVIIYDDGFNYLTKMCLTKMRDAAFEMSEFAKEKGCVVIVSSSDAADNYEKYLDRGADFIVIGEGEQTLLELVNHLNKNNSIEDINGLAFRKEGKTILTSKRDVLRNLDDIPMPAWDLINMDNYKSAWINAWGYFSLNMATTRGCPFKCNWCAKPIYGNRYNVRSPQNVVDELKYLRQHYGFDHIWFCDDIFGLKPGWVKEFADILEKENFRFRFKIQARVDLLLEENNIASLAKSGCETAWVGAESGSQKILDAMDKGTTVEQIYEATKLLKKYSIKPAFFLQFGYIGETLEDIEKTIKMLIDLMPDDIGISVSYPLPGTKFYDKVKEELKEKTNWKHSDELALMFHNTFQPKFYKRLHRLVHKKYRRKQGLKMLENIFSKPSEINFKKINKALSLIYYIPTAAIDSYRLNHLSKL